MKARSQVFTNQIRRFKVPPFNLDTIENYDLVDRANSTVTEPLVTINMKDKELKDMVFDKLSPTVIFPCFPCHTQAVERYVKLVTEASTAVCQIFSDSFSFS